MSHRSPGVHDLSDGSYVLVSTTEKICCFLRSWTQGWHCVAKFRPVNLEWSQWMWLIHGYGAQKWNCCCMGYLQRWGFCLCASQKFIKMPFSSSFVGHRHNLTERGRITITLELPLSIMNECKIASINQYNYLYKDCVSDKAVENAHINIISGDSQNKQLWMQIMIPSRKESARGNERLPVIPKWYAMKTNLERTQFLLIICQQYC